MRVSAVVIGILVSVPSISHDLEIAELPIQPCFKVEYSTQLLGPDHGYLDRVEPKFLPQTAKISAYIGLASDPEAVSRDEMLRCARVAAADIGLSKIAVDADGLSSEFKFGVENCLRQEKPNTRVELAALVSHTLCE